MRTQRSTYTQQFFGKPVVYETHNAQGQTKKQVDRIYNNRDRDGEVRHICWFVPCKTYSATIRCRICGGKRPL